MWHVHPQVQAHWPMHTNTGRAHHGRQGTRRVDRLERGVWLHAFQGPMVCTHRHSAYFESGHPATVRILRLVPSSQHGRYASCLSMTTSDVITLTPSTLSYALPRPPHHPTPTQQWQAVRWHGMRLRDGGGRVTRDRAMVAATVARKSSPP